MDVHRHRRPTKKPVVTLKALDLFCGAGGASVGLHRAGFEVIGIDNNPKRAKRYPFEFICADATDPPIKLDSFDLIWASPPCQRYTNVWLGTPEKRGKYPDLLPAVRDILAAAGRPYIIENVPGAPMRGDVVLSGAMFGLEIVRKRVFEIAGFEMPLVLQSVWLGKTVSAGQLACVAGQGANNAWNVRRKTERRTGKATKWRHLPKDLKDALRTRNCVAGWRDAMRIDWMTRDELREAVPPDYSEFLARGALDYWRKANAAA